MEDSQDADALTYDGLHAQFAWDIPARFNFGVDVVDKWAAETPDHLALIWADDKGTERRFTFDDMRVLSNRFANYPASKGVGKGDRVVVMLPRIPEWQIAVVGCIKLGAVPIPSVTMLTRKDMDYRVDHSGAVAVVTTAENTEKLSEGMRIRLAVGGEGGGVVRVTGVRRARGAGRAR